MSAKTINREKPRLKKQYDDVIRQEIVNEYSLSNYMQAPMLEKVVLNIGMGEASKEPKSLESAENELATIAGQKPIITRAKKSIAAFKVRDDQPLGLKVTIRGDRMFEFVDRFLSLAIPRMRDFRGLSRKSFDKQGNYSVGIQEQLIFPEIDYDKITNIRGMDITFVIKSESKDHSERLLEKLGFPLKEKK